MRRVVEGPMAPEEIEAYLRLLDVDHIWAMARPADVREPDGFEVIGELCLRLAIGNAMRDVSRDLRSVQERACQIIFMVRDDGYLTRALRHVQLRLERGVLRAWVFDARDGRAHAIRAEFWRTQRAAKALNDGKVAISDLLGATAVHDIELDPGILAACIFVEKGAHGGDARSDGMEDDVLATMSPAGRRGPPPLKMTEIAERMREELRTGAKTIDELRGTKQESLAAEYGVSRDTIAKAIRVVLSELSGAETPTKLRQTPT